MIYLGQQIANRVKPTSSSGAPVIAISVHPGTVDTDLQNTWTESYGMLGKMIELVTRKVAKSAPEGAEAGLWAATWDGINKENWSQFQVSSHSRVVCLLKLINAFVFCDRVVITLKHSESLDKRAHLRRTTRFQTIFTDFVSTSQRKRLERNWK